MNRFLPLVLTALCAVFCTSVPGNDDTVCWTADTLPEPIEQFGSPCRIDTPLGAALRFDGVDDGFFLDAVPVAGMPEFTLEAVFRQDGDAAFEQRFLHIGTMDRRILFETRVKEDGTWYFDAFVNLGTPEPTPDHPNPVRRSAVLIDETLTHPAGRWYDLALVASPEGLVSYVDGIEQCRSALPWTPEIPEEGLTSLGVRQNKVCWFKGDIYKIRITPRVLRPDEFLKDQDALNR